MDAAQLICEKVGLFLSLTIFRKLILKRVSLSPLLLRVNMFLGSTF